jgi:protein-S-isoprenylcysteine O-methyltransferase Ste14
MIKLPILLAAAVFYDRAFTPPTLPPSPDEQKPTLAEICSDRFIGWYETLLTRPVLLLWLRVSAIPQSPAHDRLSVHDQITYGAFTLTEAAALLRVAGNPDPQLAAPHLTKTFLLGTALTLTGAALRLACFRALGRHFTFALSLRADHTLITHGPYAVVRHPAYTGGGLTVLGSALALLGDGSWWRAGGYATLWGAFLSVNLAVCSAFLVRGLARGPMEDAYLERRFGEHWVRWAREVPYRYIPGVC